MAAPKWIVPVSLRGYQRGWLGPDVLAGVILAAVAIPEVMGYTSISQTPIVTGLYTILIPILAFAISFALGYRRPPLQFALVMLTGLALTAVFWLNIVAYTTTNTSSLLG